MRHTAVYIEIIANVFKEVSIAYVRRTVLIFLLSNLVLIPSFVFCCGCCRETSTSFPPQLRSTPHIFTYFSKTTPTAPLPPNSNTAWWLKHHVWMLNLRVQINCCCCCRRRCCCFCYCCRCRRYCCCCSDLRHKLQHYWAPLSCLLSTARLCLVLTKVKKY